jgi:hypothetical protein
MLRLLLNRNIGTVLLLERPCELNLTMLKGEPKTLATFAQRFSDEHCNALRGWKPQLPLPVESGEPWLAKNRVVLSHSLKCRVTGIGIISK